MKVVHAHDLVASVETELGLAEGLWEVRCAAVTEETLVSQSYRALPVPVFALAELEREPERFLSATKVIACLSFPSQ